MLDNASKYLNVSGMKKFVNEIQITESKENTMSLEGNTVVDKYTGQKTAPYIGKYETDGVKCSCSYFKSHKLCRHIIFFRKTTRLNLFEIKMFPNNLRKIDYQEDDDQMEDDDDQAAGEIPVPASPGMEHMIEEEQNKAKRLKPNVKYNQAFEATKGLTQYLAQVKGSEFKEQIETINELTELVRRGLPDDVKKVIKEHYSKVTSKSDSETESLLHSESEDEVDIRSQLKQVAPEHLADLAGWRTYLQSLGNGKGRHLLKTIPHMGDSLDGCG